MAGSFDCLRIRVRSFAGRVLVAKELSAELSRTWSGGDDRGARLAMLDTRAADCELSSERRVEDIGIGAIALRDSLVARQRQSCLLLVMRWAECFVCRSLAGWW